MKKNKLPIEKKIRRKPVPIVQRRLFQPPKILVSVNTVITGSIVDASKKEQTKPTSHVDHVRKP